MRILITGISGFVARHFIHLLTTHSDSYEVLGIYNMRRPDFSDLSLNNINLQLIQVNLTDKQRTKEVIASFKPTHILHLASRSSVAYSWQQPGELLAENTSIFLNIIEALRMLNLKCKMLSVGSAEEYGQVNKECLPLKECACTHPVSPYGAARVFQNNLVSIYSKNFGLDLTHTRSFNHIGAYQNENFVIGSFIKQISEQIIEGKKHIQLVVGDIEVIRDFTDVRDVVKAYYLLLLKGEKGETYNVCSGNGYRLKDLISLFADLTQTEIQCVSNPNFLRPTENKVLIGSYDKLNAETGWYPHIPIEQSLSDLFDFWKQRLTSDILQ